MNLQNKKTFFVFFQTKMCREMSSGRRCLLRSAMNGVKKKLRANQCEVCTRIFFSLRWEIGKPILVVFQNLAGHKAYALAYSVQFAKLLNCCTSFLCY